VNALPAGQSLLLTGHSQGGTRAALASMYLRKRTGVSYETVSFAATGAACMARRLYNTGANFLRDVNPYIRHPQITECAPRHATTPTRHARRHTPCRATPPHLTPPHSLTHLLPYLLTY
jgi:hypothetical protein